jgi:acyl-CoA synthetase (NDP forming)
VIAGGDSAARRQTGVIDLRPLFAPRSIAVVGASPRSWIAETVRDNLRVMNSATRCHFVNPNYGELHGQPCYPSLDALPERPDVAIVALNPLRAAMVTRDAAAAGVPAVIIPGGGVVEGGEAAAAMQAEVARIAREHGLALVGPNCMGVIDLTANAATYIGDVSPWLPRGGVAGIAQSGSVTDAFVQSGSRVGFSRIISCGSEVVLDVCDYLAYCLDDPETTSVILFVEGFKRPERFLALADRALELGKPIMAVKVGRSDQAQAAAMAHTGSLAGEARVIDAALDAAGVIRCVDLDELLETAELVEGVRRTGRRVGRGRTGVVTVSTGEGSLIADLAPLTGVDLSPIPPTARRQIMAALPTMGYVGNPLDPWGAADPPTAYGAAFEAMAGSGAYDVLVLVHDFPYRSAPAEVATANDVTLQLLAATRDRPEILPVYVSLTSGEPPPETKAVLDGEGGGAPLFRGETLTSSTAGGWAVARRVVGARSGSYLVWRRSWCRSPGAGGERRNERERPGEPERRSQRERPGEGRVGPGPGRVAAAIRVRQPRASPGCGPSGDRRRARPRWPCRRRRGGADRRSGGAQTRCRRFGPQERSWRCRPGAQRPCGGARGRDHPARARSPARSRRSGATRGTDGEIRCRADPGHASRSAVRARGAGRARRDLDRGA